MKKTLSLILAVIMLLGAFSLTAFAETPKNQTDITAIVPAKALSYEMVIPAATTLTEEAHENVLLGADGKVSITNVKNGTDKVNVVYAVDLSNGTLTDGTNTIAATYKYKQGEGEFATIDNTTKVTVYENATVKDSFVNVTADDTQWKAAPAGTYNATVTFNFAKVDCPTVTFTASVDPDYGTATFTDDSSGQTITTAKVPVGTTWTLDKDNRKISFSNGLNITISGIEIWIVYNEANPDGDWYPNTGTINSDTTFYVDPNC